MESKSQIRQRMLKLRRDMSLETHREKCQSIFQRLIAEPDFNSSRSVLLYLSSPEEVDTNEMVNEAFRQDKRVCLPVVEPGNDHLTLVWAPGPEIELQRGPFGIRQPVSQAAEQALPEDLDLVITPGLAFAPSGSRLGYGKGYFDRLFSRLKPGCLRAALAFDFQILDILPQAEWDRPVHRIISESKTTVCFDPQNGLDSI